MLGKRTNDLPVLGPLCSRRSATRFFSAGYETNYFGALRCIKATH